MTTVEFDRWTLRDDLDSLAMYGDTSMVLLLEPVINDAFGEWRGSKLVRPAVRGRRVYDAGGTELDLTADADLTLVGREVGAQIENASDGQIRGYIRYRTKVLSE